MNANEFIFGIEIETVAPNSAVQNDGLRIGSYKRGIQVPYLPAGWKAEADGSIDNSAGGHKCEIVSPVLRGADGINQVIEVVRTLEAKGHRVNVSCGVHVHVGWDRTWTADALARLVTIVAYVERGLYAITRRRPVGRHTRRHAPGHPRPHSAARRDTAPRGPPHTPTSPLGRSSGLSLFHRRAGWRRPSAADDLSNDRPSLEPHHDHHVLRRHVRPLRPRGGGRRTPSP